MLERLFVIAVAVSALSFGSCRFALSKPLTAGASGPAKFSPLLGKRFIAKCRMGQCQWLKLESARFLGRSSKGELYEVSQKWWTSCRGPPQNDGRGPLKFERNQSSYVFCSKTMPAIMGIYDGKKEGYFIYPGTDSVAATRRLRMSSIGRLVTARRH